MNQMRQKKTMFRHLRLPCQVVAAAWLISATAFTAHSSSPGYFGFGAINNKMAPGASGAKAAKIVPVKNEAEFEKACKSLEPLVVVVMKDLDFGTRQVHIQGNKEIRPGQPTKGNYLPIKIKGCLFLKGSDVIIHRLAITNPPKKLDNGKLSTGDGITLWGPNVQRVVIYKCDVYNCGDCCIDVTKGATNVTIAYCRFWNATKFGHRFGFQLAADESKKNDVFVTMHHNHFGRGLTGRLPRISGGKAGESTGGVDRYARVHLVNNYYDTNGRSSTYQITLFDYFDLIAEGNSFTCPNNAWVYRTFGGEGYKGGELRKGLKMHVKMTDSFFYGKTLTIPPKKKGEPATSRFAYTTWGSPMLRFQRFYHPNASKDRKNNERNFLSFLLPENKEEFKGTHFVTYQHDVLKADKVKDHVLAHAGVSSNTDRRK